MSPLGSFVSSGSEQSDKKNKKMTDGAHSIIFNIDSGLEDVAPVLVSKVTLLVLNPRIRQSDANKLV